jgi:4-hydroxy-2-oxoheptanedioate aldolase
MGTRGLAASRAADYGQGQPLADCIEFLNEQTLVVVQIESAKAVDNLEEIVAVGGVDVAFIGPTDLSNSFGLPGNIKHPIVQGAIQRIVDVVLQSDVALGIMVSDGAAALTWLEKGARYITTTLEGLLGASSGTFLNTAREHGVRQ